MFASLRSKTSVLEGISFMFVCSNLTFSSGSYAGFLPYSDLTIILDLTALSGLSRLVCGRNLTLSAFSSGGTSTP